MSLNPLHICSLNCQGLRKYEKRIRLKEWIKQQKCNIIFLQETHFSNNSIDKEFTGDLYHSFGSTQSRGVSIYINQKIKYEIIDKYVDQDGRIVLINTEIDKNIFTFVNLYAPNTCKDRNIFFKKALSVIEKYSLGIIIIGGDMNETLNIKDRKSNRKDQQKIKNKTNGLKTLIKKLKVIDIWRAINPNKTQYTWKRKNNEVASRIDYFLVSQDVRPRVLSTDIRPATIQYTDHLAISLKINHCQGNKGKGYFKLNNSILNDESYKIKINTLIDKYEKLRNKKSLAIVWDLFKIEVREKTIEHCKLKAKQKRDEITKLEQKLKLLNEIHDNNLDGKNNNLPNIIDSINKTEETLQTLYSDKIKRGTNKITS
ncbi:blast:LINE-1 retrotransposable element ORF2 protein [Mytilus galloprovincialis]|uniref:exodeoxyribonuclease III n=1 Tax=Mytilus galloprovincialis TaxID=29158 RepID=A0A8B6D6K6_MYTGA|nr:blast:LINE-1 retrotransposable element ORF2 protein [Mytilus galloprovincialis]